MTIHHIRPPLSHEYNTLIDKFEWEELPYWNSGEWQVVEERLADLDAAGIRYNPGRPDLFKALDQCPYAKTKVVLVGQDPYPSYTYATGLAFSIPKRCKQFPPTLTNILKEYSTDLHLPTPAHGDLSTWSKQGVLLWNAVPTCLEGKSLSHNWEEWQTLTQQIITKASEKCCVIVFLGSLAKNFAKYVKPGSCEVIELSHPSPLGSLSAKNPFIGSRMFTTINDKLNGMGIKPIDWEIKDGRAKQGTEVQA
jgi:uracil-DNA glycosylase